MPPTGSTGRAVPRASGPVRPRDLLVAGATLAVGTPLLRAALSSPRGGASFRRRTLALAATWVAGAAATGALRPEFERRHGSADVVRPAATAAGAVLVFSAGAAVVARVPALRREIDTVLAHAERGSRSAAIALALVTGAAEEAFFRGTVPALAARAGLPPVATGTAVYAVVTCATGNRLLVLAAAALGVLTGVERERTGGLLAPTVVHLGWTLGMVEILPRVTGLSRRTPHGAR